jgi:DNA-3-methyladenine glycosylase II
MFAMFHAGRRDILPVGDLGVRKGFQALYGLRVILHENCSRLDSWQPSFACS